jgi:hypothetical protein
METCERKEIITCACGCGGLLTKRDSHNRPRKFLSGHNMLGSRTAKRVLIKCDYCDIEYEQLECKLRYKHHFCSNHCRAKWVGSNSTQTIDYKKKKREAWFKTGKLPPRIPKEKHWNWKGGIWEGPNARLSDPEYLRWRKSVFYKDNYTCQICGIRGGRLSAHHMKVWAKYPELRYDVDNGQCLCYDCHMELHGLKKKQIINIAV